MYTMRVFPCGEVCGLALEPVSVFLVSMRLLRNVLEFYYARVWYRWHSYYLAVLHLLYFTHLLTLCVFVTKEILLIILVLEYAYTLVVVRGGWCVPCEEI